MPFNETYFGSWYLAAMEALKKRESRQALPQTMRSADKLEQLVRQVDSDLQRYAGEWSQISDMHARNGVYRQIREFIGEQRGLLVDLGCGTANFLAECGNIPAIGVDLNGYCLQLAEQNLNDKGFPVRRYSKSILSFNPKRGFEVTPTEGDLYLDGITLLNDDITQLQMTKQILGQAGIKADVVTFILWGGRNVYEEFHFLDPKVGSFDYKSAARLTKYNLMEQLPHILKSGGRFYLAMRVNLYAEQAIAKLGTMQDMFQDLAGSFGEVKRLAKIPLQTETGLTTIVIRHPMFNTFESPELRVAEIVLN